VLTHGGREHGTHTRAWRPSAAIARTDRLTRDRHDLPTDRTPGQPAVLPVPSCKLGNLILRAYVSRDIALLVRAFIVYVRPILEYNSVIWSPQTKDDITVLENVQRRFTKRLPGLRHFSYKQRLEELNLTSLELCGLHLDLIMCYKISFGLIKLCFEDFFQFKGVCNYVPLTHISWFFVIIVFLTLCCTS